MVTSSIREGTTQRFVKSTIWNHIGKTFQFVMGFLLTVVISRKLGESQYGEYSFFISACLFTGLLIQFGFENILNNYIPKLEINPGQIGYLVKRLIYIRICILIFASLVILVLSNIIDKTTDSIKFGETSIYAVGYISFTSMASLLSIVLISKHRTKYLSTVNIIVSASQLIITYLFLSRGFGLNILLLIITSTAAMACLCYLGAIREFFTHSDQSISLRPFLHFGIISWLARVVEFGLGKQIDILLIGFFVTSISEAGFYNIGISTPSMLSGLMTAGLGGVVLATMSEIEQKGEKDKFGTAWKSMFKLQFLLSAPLVGFLIVFAKPIVIILYTEAYLPVVLLIQVFSLFYFAQKVIGGGTHITALYTIKKENIVLYLRFMGGAINLVLDVILIPIYGAMGAIVATGISMIITVGSELIAVKKILHYSLPISFVFKVTIAITLSLLFLSFFKVESIISLTSVAMAYLLLIPFTLFFLKPFNSDDRKIIGHLNIPTLNRLVSLYKSVN